ncbi:MAG TPA: alpha/beta hydrolase [Candidatus Cybelea sp.]|nr:alpha/beta hydrolase [Candidatus Cybelea sp.]
MSLVRRVVFLPGASGDPGFWRAAGDRLPASWRKTYLAWPGLGHQSHDPTVMGMDDLVALAETAIGDSSAIVAQSMGGIVAVRLALKSPEAVTHLVLAATSGGIDMSRFGASDWRAEYRREYPAASSWILDSRPDHTADLKRLRQPVLLLWGDNDPISPVAVGQYLATLLPRAALHVVAGGDHGLAQNRAADVAPLIEKHLSA